MASLWLVKYPYSLGSVDSTILSRYLAMRGRLPTIARAAVWLTAAIVLVACQAPVVGRVAPKGPTPQTIELQPGDLPGMHRCAESGDVVAVLNGEKMMGSPAYDIHATEWEQWKQQGAVDAYFAVFGRSAADCAAASDSSSGAPPGKLMVGLVVQFGDTSGAAKNFQRDSTLMGLGPKNIRFIELAGGTTTFGSSTGLGVDSVVGSANVAGADYFVAMWQSRRFESSLIGYNMAFADADNAMLDMNRRIQQT
jgi:hypothetical protein